MRKLITVLSLAMVAYGIFCMWDGLYGKRSGPSLGGGIGQAIEIVILGPALILIGAATLLVLWLRARRATRNPR